MYIGSHVHIVNGDRINVGEQVIIRPFVDIWAKENSSVVIGINSQIGERCRLSIANSLLIGNKVLLSPNVYITDCDHRYGLVDVPVMDQDIVANKKKVEIKDNSFIGINSVIIGNVVIGKGSVIGANSVVTKNIPDYCVAAGNPCRVIK